MRKKIVYISISSVILIGIILSINSAPINKINSEKEIQEKINNKSLAIYLENENGNYTKTTTFPNKGEGYSLNQEKSVCNGNANLSWNNELWGIELTNVDREETQCFLYFDKEKQPPISFQH